MIDSPYCEKVKRGDNTAEDFAAFLHHVGICPDCTRRIYSQILVKFKQKETGDK
jgi:hypothetical protein